MGQVTRLGDLIEKLAELDQDATIYAAEPWTGESSAILEHEPESGGVPSQAAQLGLTYFLEVFLAQEFFEGWEANRDSPSSNEECCSRLIRYAVDDA